MVAEHDKLHGKRIILNRKHERFLVFSKKQQTKKSDMSVHVSLVNARKRGNESARDDRKPLVGANLSVSQIHGYPREKSTGKPRVIHGYNPRVNEFSLVGTKSIPVDFRKV